MIVLVTASGELTALQLKLYKNQRRSPKTTAVFWMKQLDISYFPSVCVMVVWLPHLLFWGIHFRRLQAQLHLAISSQI